MANEDQKWFTVGAFLLATLIGWGGAYGLSKFVDRSATLAQNETLKSTESYSSEDEPIPNGKVSSSDKDPTASTSEEISSTKNSLANNKPSNKTPKRYIDIVTRRSIFDSTKANVVPEKSSAEGQEVASDLELSLLATIVATPAEFSVAMIKENRGGSTLAYGVGFEVIGEATVVEITRNRVYFQRKGSSEREFIEIGAEPSSTPGKSKAKTSKSDDDSGITKTGANSYVVDQKVLDEILENPEKLYTQVRVSPKKENGEIVGYRMTGIRRKSVFYKLGIKNGDVVHSVNGKPLTSMSSAMDAYNSLQSSKDFSFEVTRRKQKRTFEYDVR